MTGRGSSTLQAKLKGGKGSIREDEDERKSPKNSVGGGKIFTFISDWRRTEAYI